MNLLFKAYLLPFVLVLLSFLPANAQLLTWSPLFIQESSSNVEITVDASKGNQGLLNHTPTSDVYVHIGVITNQSTSPTNWKYAPFTWNSTNPLAQAVYLGNNKWKYTISGNLRTFFGMTNPAEKILRIAILFRSGNGTKAQRNADGTDMYVPVYEPGLQVRIETPIREPKFTPVPEPITANAGDVIPITGVSSESAKLRVIFNGYPRDSVFNATTISTTVNAVSGDNMVVLEGSNANGIKYDTINFFINTPVITAPQPAGTVDGINYHTGNTSATLVLHAPNKTRVAVIGDFNNWTQTTSYQMFRTPDGSRYWITLTGLVPGVEYAYQYLVDGNLRIADPYTEKILDPWNDQYITTTTYPALKPYPAGQSGIVSVLQTQQPVYNWSSSGTSFTKPDKRNLIIYELLVRDFVDAHDWKTLRDTLNYLKKLGINAIEIMPFNEFEGNNSWGYNPSFYFAPDKYYGPSNSLKEFIDSCHSKGFAVIMDIVLNHSFGLSPLAQLYWDAANNRPAANNPWYNAVAPHATISWGQDFNHESAATKNFFNRVLQYWLTEYKIDGYRFDFTKGLTQKPTSSEGAFSAYDAGRIAIINGYATAIRSLVPDAYIILEHWTENTEEMELANNGMLLWGNVTHQYAEAAKGALANSNFQWGIHTNRGWATPNLVTYIESHDEERLMYSTLNYGNSSFSYNTRVLTTALKRMEMVTAFWSMIPGPKMVWQFGEMGYDQSINRCPNGTINNACRTDPKPILWNYLTDVNRAALQKVYSRLFALRNHAPYLPTFVTNNVDYSLTGAFKWMKVTTAALRICVIGNFDVVPVTGSVVFQTPGTWYDYITGATFNATGSTQTITLQPGEYYVYLDRDANAALPLTLLSFTARRSVATIDLVWKTTNEVNVKQFDVERSFNGSEYTRINSVAATNRIDINNYHLSDADATALTFKGKIFYRLKMIDKDGKYSYSNTAVVNDRKIAEISFYPNPARNGRVTAQLTQSYNGNITAGIQDASGRVCRTVNVQQNTQGLITIDINGLSNGIYLLNLRAGAEIIAVGRFIVQN